MSSNQIPAQLFYKIGQVSQHTGVKPHVLRYWEAEFGLVKPRKDKQGQRLYKQRDIDIILRIKELLYDQRYSIQGAKQKLKEELAQPIESSATDDNELRVVVNRHKEQIQELLNFLKSTS